MATQDVDEALRAAGIPIVGVSCPTPDKATWRVDFAPEATQAHRDQAAALIAAYTDPTPNTLLDKFAEVRLGERALKAWAKAVYEAIPGTPTRTWDDTRARAKAIFKQQP